MSNTQALKIARDALELASTIADRVPTRWHELSPSSSPAEHDIGHMVNAQPDGQHGYRLIHDALSAVCSALAQPKPSVPSVEPSAPFLFVQMDDDNTAHLTWCRDAAAVHEAVKGAMFFSHDGAELDADHTEQLAGSVEELMDSGALTFEGDPPLYLYRVSGTAPTAQPAPTVPEWRPIETAPDDMFPYLFRVNDIAVEGFKDASGALCVRTERRGWYVMRGKPTHWMPLPAAPQGPPRLAGW